MPNYTKHTKRDGTRVYRTDRQAITDAEQRKAAAEIELMTLEIRFAHLAEEVRKMVLHERVRKAIKRAMARVRAQRRLDEIYNTLHITGGPQNRGRQ
jgi:hypothetical protein